MKLFSFPILLLAFSVLASAQTYLTPLDFGLPELGHGLVDFNHPPPGVLAGNFNTDSYPDIARFRGNRLEIFLCDGLGYPYTPQQTKTFDVPIRELHFGGSPWEPNPPLKVVFTDGSQAQFRVGPNGLIFGSPAAAAKPPGPPRHLDDLDFQIAWESPQFTDYTNQCVVGDLDNDGVMEFISKWRIANYSDTCHIVIYKCTGDNTYDLYMDVPFTDPMVAPVADVSYFLITDIDRDGHKELMFTFDGAYFWEFTAPGHYTEYRSNFIFPRGVADAKVTDVDQDGVLELTTVMRNYDMEPPGAYWVCEFDQKDTINHNMNFTILSGFWQDWGDARLAVGDFDRDGAVDLIPGNFYVLGSWHLVDLPFYRYNPSSSTKFDLYWMPTGLAIRCATPVLGDFDQDGELELFAGGFTYGAPGDYLWESTGLMSGYPVWVDTVNEAHSIDFSSFGYVDSLPSVVSSYTPEVAPTTTSQLSLWRREAGQYGYAWVTPYLYSSDYRLPQIADMDGDGKASILLVEDDHNQMLDWEQTASGVEPSLVPSPQQFRLHPVFPNPFNSETVIRYDITVRCEVRLSIYDVTGRIVYDEYRKNELPGPHLVNWNADRLGSGLYLVRLESGAGRQTVKAVLIK